MGLTQLLVWTTATALPLACCPAEASATPSRGVTSVLLSQSTHNGYDYITRDITISPGGSTGWHWHDGELVGVVKQGTLTTMCPTVQLTASITWATRSSNLQALTMCTSDATRVPIQ
jgi:hypothetical protein